MLTPKVQELFKEWLKPKTGMKYQGGLWNILPLTCQLALIVEFLDGKGIEIFARPYKDGEFFVYIDDKPIWTEDRNPTFPNRNSALTSAIQKASQILEERL